MAKPWIRWDFCRRKLRVSGHASAFLFAANLLAASLPCNERAEPVPSQPPARADLRQDQAGEGHGEKRRNGAIDGKANGFGGKEDHSQAEGRHSVAGRDLFQKQGFDRFTGKCLRIDRPSCR